MPDNGDYLGSGPIPPDQIEHVLRQVRHRVNSMSAAQRAQTELLRHNSEEVHEIKGRVFGYTDDPEGGAIGRLRAAQVASSRQNWAIILLLLTVLGGVIATLATHH